jgi:hypothetical protein
MCNTLGNFAVHPQAGLVFIHFDRGAILSLSGDVDLEWDIPGTQAVTTGTRRFWRFRVAAWRQSALSRRPRWEYIDSSPMNPEVGNPLDSTGHPRAAGAHRTST